MPSLKDLQESMASNKLSGFYNKHEMDVMIGKFLDIDMSQKEKRHFFYFLDNFRKKMKNSEESIQTHFSNNIHESESYENFLEKIEKTFEDFASYNPKPKQLAFFIRFFPSLSVELSSRTLQRWFQFSQSLLPKFQHQDLFSSIWALGRLLAYTDSVSSKEAKRFIETWLPVVKKKLSEFNIQQLSRSLWALIIIDPEFAYEFWSLNFSWNQEKILEYLSSKNSEEEEVKITITQVVFSFSYLKYVLKKEEVITSNINSSLKEIQQKMKAQNLDSKRQRTDFEKQVTLKFEEYQPEVEVFILEIHSKVDNYFTLGDKKIIIEADGPYHLILSQNGERKEGTLILKNRRRDDILRELGYFVYRISYLEDLDLAAKQIKNLLHQK